MTSFFCPIMPVSSADPPAGSPCYLGNTLSTIGMGLLEMRADAEQMRVGIEACERLLDATGFSIFMAQLVSTAANMEVPLQPRVRQVICGFAARSLVGLSRAAASEPKGEAKAEAKGETGDKKRSTAAASVVDRVVDGYRPLVAQDWAAGLRCFNGVTYDDEGNPLPARTLIPSPVTQDDDDDDLPALEEAAADSDADMNAQAS